MCHKIRIVPKDSDGIKAPEKSEQQPKQTKQNKRRQENTKNLLEQAGLFNGVLRFSAPNASTKQRVADRRIMDKHGLIDSQAVEKKQLGFAEKALDFFMPAAYGDEGSERNSELERSEPVNSIPRERFNLLSNLPTHSANKFLNYSYAVGRGIEHARDATTDVVVHPIYNAKELVTVSWDGLNAISGVLFGYSSASSRIRNRERGVAILDGVNQFKQADGAKKVEVITEIVASTVLGAAMVVTVGKGLRGACKAGKKSYYAKNFDKALLNPISTEGHIFSKTKSKNPGISKSNPKDGHVVNTLQNKKDMIETFVDPKRNFIFEQKHGKQTKRTLARLLPGNKAESWVHLEKGKIKSAGVNETLQYFNTDGTLLPKYSSLAQTKQLQNTVEITFETSAGAIVNSAKNNRKKP